MHIKLYSVKKREKKREREKEIDQGGSFWDNECIYLYNTTGLTV